MLLWTRDYEAEIRGQVVHLFIYLPSVHLVLVGVHGSEEAEQPEGLGADGASLLGAQEAEQGVEQLRVLCVRLRDAPCGLNQLRQRPQAHLALLGGRRVAEDVQQQGKQLGDVGLQKKAHG